MRTYSILVSLFLVLGLFSPSFGQDSTSNYSEKTYRWGIGLKSNNGITLKRYKGDKGFELIINRPSPWRNNYYESDNPFKNQGYNYAGYENISRPWALQLRYLIHNDIAGLRGFQWYYGTGIQMIASSYYYHYYYQNGNSIEYKRKRINNLSTGVDAVAGVEYTFKNFPLSAFYDVNVYVEGFKHPLRMRVQSGIGLRYNF